MEATKCPHCGAPAQIPPSTQFYTCGYCKQQFDTGWRQPQVFPTKAVQQQIIIVRGPGLGSDDDDSPRSAAPIQRSAATGCSWVIWAIVMVVVVIVAGGGAVYGVISKNSSFASKLVWDGKSPFTCSGNDDYSVKEVHAELASGTAITASGNCHFTCTDCTIKAPTAIEAGGNATVTIVNGTITGTETLADASANAHVNISGNATASGAIKQSSNAKVSAPKPATSIGVSGSAEPSSSSSKASQKKR